METIIGKKRIISDEHRKHLSESLTLWWKLNKEENPESIEIRNNNVSKSLIGNIPWNKGKTNVYSEETIEKLSNLRKGRPPANKDVKTGVIKNCAYCNKEFYTTLSQKNRKCCSHKCAGILKQKDISQYLTSDSIISSQKLKKMYIEFIGKCEICEFYDIRILMIHHKDGNRKK